MKFIVSAKTKQATTKCEKGFSCLNGGRENICKVERNFDEVIFVKCLHTDSCDYKMSFGYSAICNCPTKKEIFNKYGK